MICFIFSFT